MAGDLQPGRRSALVGQSGSAHALAFRVHATHFDLIQSKGRELHATKRHFVGACVARSRLAVRLPQQLNTSTSTDLQFQVFISCIGVTSSCTGNNNHASP